MRPQALVDARRLAEAVAQPARRISHHFAYSPLDPTRLDTVDGIVFVKEAVGLE